MRNLFFRAATEDNADMIILKTQKELLAMREAGRISNQALLEAGKHIRAGMTTKELDRILHDFILSKGAKPSFFGIRRIPRNRVYFHQQRSYSRYPRLPKNPGRRHRQH